MVRLSLRRHLVGLAVLALAGCQAEAISSYRVPRVEKSPVRLLGAMAPVGDTVWFLKLVGPAPEIAAHEKDFDQFVRSLRFAEDTKSPLTWALPDGWREVAATPSKSGLGEQTRFATFRVGTEAMKLTISRLGREAAEILPNVNRWRKNDLGLPPIAEAELSTATRTVDVAGHSVTIVDMTGNKDDTATLPAPPMQEPGNAEALAYDAPNGWQSQPTSAMSVADFKISTGDKTAKLTISPLAGAAGGLLANVNRWRQQQLGLPATTEIELQKQATMLESKAGPAVYVDLKGTNERILAAILLHGGKSWFVKLKGPSELVGAEQANFEAFVKSLRFEAGAK